MNCANSPIYFYRLVVEYNFSYCCGMALLRSHTCEISTGRLARKMRSYVKLMVAWVMR